MYFNNTSIKRSVMVRHPRLHDSPTSHHRRLDKSECVAESARVDRMNPRRGPKELDVSPSKSSRTSVLSYSTESLSSSSSETARNNHSLENENDAAQASPSRGHRLVTYELSSEMNHFHFTNGTNRVHPVTSYGLSPASLTEDSVITWNDSALQPPFESLIDSKPSQISTDDDNDTIQVMTMSTKQFQSVGKQQNPAPPVDGSFFPTMFAKTENPFSHRYRPVSLSHVGQSVNRFQDTSPLGSQHRKKYNKRDYALKSLTPERGQGQEQSRSKSLASIFWSKTMSCFMPSQSFADDEDECNRGCIHRFHPNS